MALFLIVYRSEYSEDYLGAVERLIDSWGGKRVFGSTWLVDMVSSEKFIFDALYEHIHKFTDSLIITRIDAAHCLAHRVHKDLADLGITISDR